MCQNVLEVYENQTLGSCASMPMETLVCLLSPPYLDRWIELPLIWWFGRSSLSSPQVARTPAISADWPASSIHGGERTVWPHARHTCIGPQYVPRYHTRLHAHIRVQSMLTADDGRTATASCSSECTLRSTCSGQSHAKWKRPRCRCTSGNGNLTSPAARVACFWWTQPVQYWIFFCHENSGVVLYFYNYLQFL